MRGKGERTRGAKVRVRVRVRVRARVRARVRGHTVNEYLYLDPLLRTGQ